MVLQVSVKKKNKKVMYISALKRFGRVVVPQLVLLVPTLVDWTPIKYAPFWSALGALITALDKLARDSNWY